MNRLWGAAATGMAFVHGEWGFFTLRIVLGIAEGGFAPGLVWYLSRWMPAQHRARPIGAIMLAVPVSVVLGGPLSGWLMNLHTPAWSGWRWMFLLEGIPTIAMAILAARLVDDRPASAQWLTAEERLWLQREIESQDVSSNQLAPGPGSPLHHWAIVGAAFCWFATMGGTYGIIYWLPQMVNYLSGITNSIDIGLIAAIPWIAVGVGMVGNSWHSDKTQERYLHVGLPVIGSGVFLGAAALAGGSVLGLLSLTVAGLWLGCAQGAFWSIPPSLTSPVRAAMTIALLNMCGNTSGLIVPALIGQMRTHSGSFQIPLALLTALLVLGGGALLMSRPRRHRRLTGQCPETQTL